MGKATKAQLKELARGIVMAQGNLYIKKLLRSKELPIHRSKVLGHVHASFPLGCDARCRGCENPTEVQHLYRV